MLDGLAGEKESSEKRRHVRAALYEGARKSDESLVQYALRREAQFSGADKYLTLPDELKAFMLEEQAGLSKQGVQNLRVLTGGSNNYREVRKALQIMDTEGESLFKAPGKANFFGDPEEAVSSAAADDEQDEDSGDDIFMVMDSLDLDEDEALSFMAEYQGRKKTWAESRQLKAARKKDRRHFDDPGGRSSRPSSSRRLSVEELKKVTKCAKCGEKGHWKAECPNAPQSKSSFKSKSQSSVAFAFLGEEVPEGSGLVLSGDLQNFSTEKEECLSSFLQIPPGFAIVDPGAAQDLIGRKAYERLEQRLRQLGLRPVKLDEQPTKASGIGGQARPLFNALVPVFIGEKPGVLKMTVLQEDVPHLLSIGLLEHLGSINDTTKDEVQFKLFGVSSKMTRLPSGHRLLDVATGDGSAFSVPEQISSQFGLELKDFQIEDSSDRRELYTALKLESRVFGSRTVPVVEILEHSRLTGQEHGLFQGFCYRVDVGIRNFQGPARDMLNPGYLRSTWVLDDRVLVPLELGVFWKALARPTCEFHGSGSFVVVTVFFDFLVSPQESSNYSHVQVPGELRSETWLETRNSSITSHADSSPVPRSNSSAGESGHVAASAGSPRGTKPERDQLGSTGEAASQATPSDRESEARHVSFPGLLAPSSGTAEGSKPVWKVDALQPLQHQAELREVLEGEPVHQDQEGAGRISAGLQPGASDGTDHREQQGQGQGAESQLSGSSHGAGEADELPCRRNHPGVDAAGPGAAGAAPGYGSDDAAGGSFQSDAGATAASSPEPDVSGTDGLQSRGELRGRGDEQSQWLGGGSVRSWLAAEKDLGVSLPISESEKSCWFVRFVSETSKVSLSQSLPQGTTTIEQIVRWQSNHHEHGCFLLWRDSGLRDDLLLADTQDDREFQVPRHHKRRIFGNVGNIESDQNSNGHFVQDACATEASSSISLVTI